MQMQRQEIRRFTEEGPDLNSQVRIIAVEFAIRANGMPEVELEMFPCRHTFHVNPYDQHEIRFTMHTSRGDQTMRQIIRF